MYFALSAVLYLLMTAIYGFARNVQKTLQLVVNILQSSSRFTELKFCALKTQCGFIGAVNTIISPCYI